MNFESRAVQECLVRQVAESLLPVINLFARVVNEELPEESEEAKAVAMGTSRFMLTEVLRLRKVAPVPVAEEVFDEPLQRAEKAPMSVRAPLLLEYVPAPVSPRYCPGDYPDVDYDFSGVPLERPIPEPQIEGGYRYLRYPGRYFAHRVGHDLALICFDYYNGPGNWKSKTYFDAYEAEEKKLEQAINGFVAIMQDRKRKRKRNAEAARNDRLKKPKESKPVIIDLTED